MGLISLVLSYLVRKEIGASFQSSVNRWWAYPEALRALLVHTILSMECCVEFEVQRAQG